MYNLPNMFFQHKTFERKHSKEDTRTFTLSLSSTDSGSTPSAAHATLSNLQLVPELPSNEFRHQVYSLFFFYDDL